MVDKERENDHVIEHEGYKILLIHDNLVDEDQPIKLDCRETKDGKKLSLS